MSKEPCIHVNRNHVCTRRMHIWGFVKRAWYKRQKSPTRMPKEPYKHVKRNLHVCTWRMCTQVYVKRAMCTRQKRPTYMLHEPCIHVQGDLCVCTWRMCIWVYTKRALYIHQKSRIYMLKEPCIHVKRFLHVCTWHMCTHVYVKRALYKRQKRPTCMHLAHVRARAQFLLQRSAHLAHKQPLLRGMNVRRHWLYSQKSVRCSIIDWLCKRNLQQIFEKVSRLRGAAAARHECAASLVEILKFSSLLK